MTKGERQFADKLFEDIIMAGFKVNDAKIIAVGVVKKLKQMSEDKKNVMPHNCSNKNSN